MLFDGSSTIESQIPQPGQRHAFFPIFVLPVLLALSTNCGAQNLNIKPFSKKDAWTFRQHRTDVAGKVEINDISFSTLYKKANGEVLPFWASAMTDTGQMIWQPLDPIPETRCVQDFVGQSDLNLPDACTNGLAKGREWLSTSDDRDEREELRFVVVGTDIVDVPAGRLNAIKIRGTGQRLKAAQPSENITITYWFAPEVKAMGRVIREYRTVEGNPVITIMEELTKATTE